MNSIKTTAFSAVLALSLVARAGAQNLIQNPDFATDTSDYGTAYSVGSAGEYNPGDPDRAGSTGGLPYSAGGGVTGLTGYPTTVPADTTAGTFIADSGDAPVPTGGFTSNVSNSVISYNGTGTFARISSASGDIYSFYQNVTTVANVPVVFKPYFTYTLSAYSTANASGPGAFANTGVGLSGGSQLTYAGIVNNPSFVSLTPATLYSGHLTMQTVSITVLPTENSDLIGQQIVANLIDEAAITGGGRNAYFTDVTLTATATPEPSTYALMLGGLGFVVWAARRRLASTV